MKTILFIVGSFRAQSFNRQLARQAETLLAPRCKVEWLDFADVPFMNQDIENPVPPAVAAARDNNPAKASSGSSGFTKFGTETST